MCPGVRGDSPVCTSKIRGFIFSKTFGIYQRRVRPCKCRYPMLLVEKRDHAHGTHLWIRLVGNSWTFCEVDHLRGVYSGFLMDRLVDTCETLRPVDYLRAVFHGFSIDSSTRRLDISQWMFHGQSYRWSCG